ncbi:wax ester/triacylglycerol synthase family O-acyltransferase [Variovorax sp. PCZ-1]|nr:wax ester/triacylglycerol synthase family O-acyltransferase [Variovorax sp. PCZ-1]
MQEAELLAQDFAEIVARQAADAGQTAAVAGKAAAKVGQNMQNAVGGTLGITGERMTKVDTAWLRMDTNENLMMIVGVWVMRPPVKLAAMQERVKEKLLKYRRFKQCVVEDTAGATWVTDRKFDIEKHVVGEELYIAKGQTAQQAFQSRVAELTMTPLDRKKPLWQFHFIENYPLADGTTGSALIARIHHCIADGIALISVTMSILDGGMEPPERKKKTSEEATQDWITQHLIKPLTAQASRAIDLAGVSAARTVDMLSDPQKGLAGGLGLARLGGKLAKDLAAMALMPNDSPTRLKGKPGRTKQVAWCAPIPLEDVKSVGKALGCSINDVLLSCVAGAIGEYLKNQGDDVSGQEIRAMVPVNLRPMEQAYKLGNRFGLAALVLPIGIDNPIDRVFEVRKRMNELKNSYQPLLAFSLLAVAGMMLKPVQDAMLNLYAKKTTAVMTNVPGPREKHTFLGSTIEEIMFWVPQAGDVGMGVSILSYGGGVQFGLITDATLCPNPQDIIDEFAPEFAKLSMITLMLPWEGEVSSSA